MDSIFRLDSKGHLVIVPDALSLVPTFSKLTSNQVRYLVLAYDSANTIFKQQKYSQWTKLSCEYCFGHSNFDKEEKKITEQVKQFRWLVYDEERIQKVKLLERKKGLQEEILTVKGSSAMKSINESIKIIEGMITDLDARISFADEEVILANKNGKLSMIEKFQRKQKLMQQ